MFSSMLENPSKEILMTFNGVSYLFALCMIAAAIAWIYYVGQAVDQLVIGGKYGTGNNQPANGSVTATEQIDTIAVMYQGTVVAVLFYIAFRHHFHHK